MLSERERGRKVNLYIAVTELKGFATWGALFKNETPLFLGSLIYCNCSK